jgi:hypothetical protein
VARVFLCESSSSFHPDKQRRVVASDSSASTQPPGVPPQFVIGASSYLKASIKELVKCALRHAHFIKAIALESMPKLESADFMSCAFSSVNEHSDKSSRPHWPIASALA